MTFSFFIWKIEKFDYSHLFERLHHLPFHGNAQHNHVAQTATMYQHHVKMFEILVALSSHHNEQWFLEQK